MYAPGHVGVALLVFAPLGAVLLAAGRVRLAASGVAVSVLTATLPDVDLFVAALAHRGLTHTLAFAILAGFALGVALTSCSLVRRSGRRPAVRAGSWVWFTVALSACSHLLGDVVTPMGVRPFAPFVDVHLTLSLVYARDPQVNAALFVAGSAATAVSWWHGTDAGRRVAVRADLRSLRAVATVGVLVRRMAAVVGGGRGRP